MKTFTFYDSGGNLSGRTKRWFGWTTFCVMLLTGQLSFAQFPNPYCNVTFPSGIEPITLVQMGTINNSTGNVVGGTPALEDFTTISADVHQTEPYTIILKGNTAGAYTCWFRVFVDWNQDGDFDDAGESYDIGSIYNSTGLDDISVVGTIIVPVDAELGSTRMRVTKKFNQYATACNSTGFGQAEDYTLNVLSAPDCVTPIEVSVVEVTSDSAELSWVSPGSLFDIKWGVLGFDVETEGSLVSEVDNPYTLTGLTDSTSYDFYVRQNCGDDGVSVWTGPYNFTTTQVPATLNYT